MREAVDIYDRRLWPPHDENPLVQLLLRGDEWYSNKELNAALDPARGVKKGRGSPMANLDLVMRMIGEEQSYVSNSMRDVMTSNAARVHGGKERFYSAKAMVQIALRANTVNAAAFRDWLCDRTVESF